MTKGVKITGTIVPANEQDDYSTNIDNFGKGGIHSVSTLIDRDAITLLRRSVGMLCYVQEDNSVYILTTGIANSDWKKLYYVENDKVIFHINLLKNYILLGGSDDIAYQSLSFKDAKQDIIDLRKLIDKDVHETKDNRRKLDDISNAHYILQSKLDIEDPDGSFPNAQYLNEIPTKGLVSVNDSGILNTTSFVQGDNITIQTSVNFETGHITKQINASVPQASKSILHACYSAGYYTSNLSNGHHFAFNNVLYSTGSDVELITSPYSTGSIQGMGDVWLEGGKTYRAWADLSGVYIYSAGTPYYGQFVLYVTHPNQGVSVSKVGISARLIQGTPGVCSPAFAYVTTPENTDSLSTYFLRLMIRVESGTTPQPLQILVQNNSDYNNSPHIVVETI